MYGFQGIGRAEKDFYKDPTKSELKKDLDRDAFLTLLVAQLGHQDPLNPMEDKEFTAQLANFSQLEQLTHINEGIGKMIEATNRQEVLSAVSYIGKDIRAEGNVLSKVGGRVSTAYYELEDTVSAVYVNIFDSWGNVVQTIQGGAMQPGSYEFSWDGLDWQGKSTPDGVYGISIVAEGLEGQPVFVNTQVVGRVAGVVTEDGQNYLRLTDGRVVNFMDIKEVVNPSASSGNTGGTGGTGGTGDSGGDSGEGEAA